MTTFANQLKSEIARIAEKEMRTEIQQLKRAFPHYRCDIAALKGHISAVEATVKKLSKGQPKPVLKVEKAPATALRFRAGDFATLLKKLNFSTAQMGKLIGLSAQSVSHWEAGTNRSRASQLSAIAAAR